MAIELNIEASRMINAVILGMKAGGGEKRTLESQADPSVKQMLGHTEENCAECHVQECPEHPEHVRFLQDKIVADMLYFKALARVIRERYGKQVVLEIRDAALEIALDMAKERGFISTVKPNVHG